MVILVSCVIDQNLDLRNSVQYRGTLNGIDYLLEMDQTFGTKLSMPKHRFIGNTQQLNVAELLTPKDTIAYHSEAENGDKRMSEFEICFRNDKLLSVDYYAQGSGFVFARVLFESNVLNKDEVNKNVDTYIGFATDVVSNYILILRYLTSSNVLTPFDKFSSPGHRIYAALDDPFAKLDDCPQLSPTCNNIVFPVRDESEPYFICSDDVNIEDFIYEGRSISVEDQLLLEAKTLAFNNSSFDTAIVLIESSFELFAARYLKEKCAEKRISKLAAPSGKHRRCSFARVIDRSNIETLLSNVALQVLGYALNNGDAYSCWINNCKKVRNGIVHRGEIGHSLNDVKLAFQAAIEFERDILSHVDDEASS